MIRTRTERESTGSAVDFRKHSTSRQACEIVVEEWREKSVKI